MPVRIGALARTFGNAILSAGKGAGGRALQGAVLGAGVGGAYGLASNRQTVIGGMMSGGMRGALGGAAFSAISGGMAMRGITAARGGNVAGAFMRGMRAAGKAEWIKSSRLARSSAGQLASTWNMAANPIKSTMKGGIPRGRPPVVRAGTLGMASASTRRRGHPGRMF